MYPTRSNNKLLSETLSQLKLINCQDNVINMLIFVYNKSYLQPNSNYLTSVLFVICSLIMFKFMIKMKVPLFYLKLVISGKALRIPSPKDVKIHVLLCFS